MSVRYFPFSIQTGTPDKPLVKRMIRRKIYARAISSLQIRIDRPPGNEFVELLRRSCYLRYINRGIIAIGKGIFRFFANLMLIGHKCR